MLFVETLGKQCRQCCLLSATATHSPITMARKKGMQVWNDAFALAMKPVHESHPDGLDPTALYSEAIMNRMPWKMWGQVTGEPAENAGTSEVQVILEAAMNSQPAAMRPPGVLHLYIHVMEMSPFPWKALKAGDALRIEDVLPYDEPWG